MTYISNTIIKEFAKKKNTLPEDPFGSVMGFVRVIHCCSTEIPPLTTFGHWRNGRISPCVIYA